MIKQIYTEFAFLCESIITETSTAMDLVKGMPGGSNVVKKLHTVGLEHDQEYKSLGKISWNELKDSSYGKWVVIKGETGVGAIRAINGSYTAYASTGQDTDSFTNDRGGNILDFLTGKIGKLRVFYAGTATDTVRNKQRTRSNLKSSAAENNEMTKDGLLTKFKPLWAKAVAAARADIKGMVVTMIKNDAFDKASKKLEQLGRLEKVADQLETGSRDAVPESIATAVNLGILMAAHHHYPDDTGDIRQNYGRSYSSSNDKGPRQLLQDISQGDTQKLGTILAFFKRSLISGWN